MPGSAWFSNRLQQLIRSCISGLTACQSHCLDVDRALMDMALALHRGFRRLLCTLQSVSKADQGPRHCLPAILPECQ